MAWYIAITNPNCHRRVENELAANGYRTFWPKLRKWCSHARVKVAKEYPILGRYLFVEIPDGNFYGVNSINGVGGLLLGTDGAPAMIPEREVWAFWRRYMQGEWDLVAKEPTVPIGAVIRIMEGEFADLLTVVRGRKNGKLKFFPPGRREFVLTRPDNVRAA